MGTSVDIDVSRYGGLIVRSIVFTTVRTLSVMYNTVHRLSSFPIAVSEVERYMCKDILDGTSGALSL